MDTTTTHLPAPIASWACSYFRMDWDEYCTMQYTRGMDYLRREYCATPGRADMMACSSLFWKWWKYHWERRDTHLRHDLAAAPERTYSVSELRELYAANHSPIVAGLHPHAIIIRKIFTNAD